MIRQIALRPGGDYQRLSSDSGADPARSTVMSTTGHASSTTKRGALKWLIQEADAKDWLSPKHVQPDEGRKEPAPRAIKFRKSRVERPQSERESASAQEGPHKRAKDTTAIFLPFSFFLFLIRDVNRRVFAPWTRREFPMVQNRERQHHNEKRLSCPTKTA